MVSVIFIHFFIVGLVQTLSDKGSRGVSQVSFATKRYGITEGVDGVLP